jgi:hypothetical protein
VVFAELGTAAIAWITYRNIAQEYGGKKAVMAVRD